MNVVTDTAPNLSALMNSSCAIAMHPAKRTPVTPVKSDGVRGKIARRGKLYFQGLDEHTPSFYNPRNFPHNQLFHFP